MYTLGSINPFRLLSVDPLDASENSTFSNLRKLIDRACDFYFIKTTLPFFLSHKQNGLRAVEKFCEQAGLNCLLSSKFNGNQSELGLPFLAFEKAQGNLCLALPLDENNFRLILAQGEKNLHKNDLINHIKDTVIFLCPAQVVSHKKIVERLQGVFQFVFTKIVLGALGFSAIFMVLTVFCTSLLFGPLASENFRALFCLGALFLLGALYLRFFAQKVWRKNYAMEFLQKKGALIKGIFSKVDQNLQAEIIADGKNLFKQFHKYFFAYRENIFHVLENILLLIFVIIFALFFLPFFGAALIVLSAFAIFFVIKDFEQNNFIISFLEQNEKKILKTLTKKFLIVREKNNFFDAMVKNNFEKLIATRKNFLQKNFSWKKYFLIVSAIIFSLFNLILINKNFLNFENQIVLGNLILFLFALCLFNLIYSGQKVLVAEQFFAQDIFFECEQNTQEKKLKPMPLKGKIDAKLLRFSYPDQSKNLFDNLHFSIEPGQFALITGESGSGKSTLLKILSGQLSSPESLVFFDGQDKNVLNQDALRRNFGVVNQQSSLVSGSIAENIMCGRHANNSRLEELMLSHEIFDALLDLPMQLNTYIFWHAENLSGFEKKLVHLARALYMEPKILFLDEVDYGLNAEQEDRLLEFLASLPQTKIMISHHAIIEHFVDQKIVLA